MNKEQLEARIKKLLKIRRLFVILSISFLALAILLNIPVIIFYNLQMQETLLFYIFIESSSLFFVASIALFFVRVFAIDVKIRNALYQLSLIVQPIDNSKVFVGESEVKDVKLDRPHELVKQYEDLLKQGLISEEDFAKKKKEILGE